MGIPVECPAGMYQGVSPGSGADGSSLFKLPTLLEQRLCPTGLSALVECSSTSKAQDFYTECTRGKEKFIATFDVSRNSVFRCF